MGHKITDRDRAESPQVQPGQRVCVIGRGTSNLVHRHPTVVRVTATQIVTRARYKSGAEVESRYWRNSAARELGSDPYGGTTLHTTCQRPKAA